MNHILGDGIAGTLLAQALHQAGHPFLQYGDGRTNTPPVAFLHLFQGRTFHRDPVEVEAFQMSTDTWRASHLAQEWKVRRTVDHGGRLVRSSQTDSVPPEWKPTKAGPEVFEYGPGFTIESQLLLREVLEDLKDSFRCGRPDVGGLKGTMVYATGLSIEEHLPELRWDTNPGRTVSALCPQNEKRKPEHIHLNKGLHMGGNPISKGFTLGGRVNSKGEAKNDEAKLASLVLGEDVVVTSEWWGKRIANALDRWPLIGWLDERRFVFAGFGGRALFWLPYCSQLATRALREKTTILFPRN